MFCQSCGAKNIDQARFCHQCGARIAEPGTPGGRTDLPRPSESEAWGPPALSLGDSLAHSLAGLGIQTKSSAYGFFVALAVSLVALGSLATYFALSDGEPSEASESSGHASPGDTFLLGAPIPEGLELPPHPEDASGSTTSTPSSAPSANAARATTTSRTPRPAAEPETAAPAVQISPLEAEEPEAAPPIAREPSKAEEPEPSPSATPSESETELELYAGRVRFAISRYYGSATQSCFDRATQKDPSVAGTVVITTKVDAGGQVTNATPSRNSTGDQSLGECLASQVRSFRLPPPPQGEIELKLPFSR